MTHLSNVPWELITVFLEQHPECTNYDQHILGPKRIPNYAPEECEIRVIPPPLPPTRPVEQWNFLEWIISPHALSPLIEPELSTLEMCSYSLTMEKYNILNPRGILMIVHKSLLVGWDKNIIRLEDIRHAIIDYLPCFTFRKIMSKANKGIFKLTQTDPSDGTTQGISFITRRSGCYLADLFQNSKTSTNRYARFSNQLQVTCLDPFALSDVRYEVNVAITIICSRTVGTETLNTKYFELLHHGYGDFSLISRQGVKFQFISLTLIATCRFFGGYFRQRKQLTKDVSDEYQTDFSTKTLEIFQRSLYGQAFGTLIQPKLLNELYQLLREFWWENSPLQYALNKYVFTNYKVIQGIETLINRELSYLDTGALPELREDFERIAIYYKFVKVQPTTSIPDSEPSDKEPSP